MNAGKIVFCTLDAQRIPFADGQFDCVFMIAALHHLPDISSTLDEITRVTKAGGVICCGMEPNRWWLSALEKTRWLFRKVFPQKDHSAADEQATGLCFQDFVRMAAANKLRILRFEPVWLLCGFVHYGLEFVYRLFRMKKRIRLPVIVERFMVQIDSLLLWLPGIQRLSWHNSIIYQKL